MKENNHLDIFSPFTWKSLYTYLILLVPFLNIFKKKIVSTLRTLPKHPRLLQKLKQKTHPEIAACRHLWRFSTHPSAVSARQVLIGCGYGPLTIGAFNLVWTSPATSRGSECPVGRRPRCKNAASLVVLGYGKDGKLEISRRKKQAESLNSGGWNYVFFTILVLT